MPAGGQFAEGHRTESMTTTLTGAQSRENGSEGRGDRRTWAHPGRELPTLDDCVKGIVGWYERPGGGAPDATVQCAVCYATYTDVAIIALQKINHAATTKGAVPYKRCPDCRAADLHPQAT